MQLTGSPGVMKMKGLCVNLDHLFCINRPRGRLQND